MSKPANNVLLRDKACRMTHYVERTEVAHIIPDSESEWFLTSGLGRWGGIGGERNLILFRVDVHQLWDQRQYTIVPRMGGEQDPKSAVWVLYVLKGRPSYEVVNLYHDVELQPLSGIDPVFLFCRFAWTIFESLDVFLRQGSPRWLAVRDAATGREVVQEFSGSQCRDQQLMRRGRTQSPTKKAKRAVDFDDDVSGGQEEEDDTASLWGDTDCDDSTCSTSSRQSVSDYYSSLDDNPARGRKRRRSTSPITTGLYDHRLVAAHVDE